MKTFWSPLEIAGNYRRSGEKPTQIKLIAECNACDEETIKQILREQGFIIKEKRKRKMVQKKTVKQTETPVKKTGVITPPDIIIEALKEKDKEIMQKLMELADRQAELKAQEEELTSQHVLLQEWSKPREVLQQ